MELWLPLFIEGRGGDEVPFQGLFQLQPFCDSWLWLIPMAHPCRQQWQLSVVAQSPHGWVGIGLQENCTAGVGSGQVEQTAPTLTVLCPCRMGGIPARNAKGERLLLYVGIIDVLQSYR